MLESRLIKVHRAAEALTQAADDFAVAIRKMPLDAMTAIYLDRIRAHVRQEIGDGISPVIVARDLNDKGLICPDGSRWTAAEILELKDRQ